MNSTSRHIILEHLIQLEFEREDDARRWQQEIGPIVRRRLMPLFDRILSAHSTPDTLIRLDTLELDLGNLDPSQVERQLEARVKALLAPRLVEEIRKQQSHAGVGHEKSRSALDLLSTFLHTGTLPWWADTRDMELLSRAIHTLAQQAPGELRRLVLAAIRKDQIFRRLLNALDEDALKNIVQAWPLSIGKPWEVLETVLTQIADKQGVSARQARKEWWKGALFGLSQAVSPSEVQVALYGLWQAMARFHWQPGDVRKAIQTAVSEVPELRIILREWDALLVQKGVAGPASQPDKKQHRDSVAPISKDIGDTKKWPTTTSETQEIFLDNAGLVLFWPFLPRFFEQAGLVKDKLFTDANAPFKAAVLLQYLGSGVQESPEYQLPLNKVLCGIPLEEPLPEDLELTPEDLADADALLSAVLEHGAPALGQISAEGLRSAFIQRNGLLSVEDGQWMLRVERETHDILLDRLPWSFRVVKLPWMPWPMTVDW